MSQTETQYFEEIIRGLERVKAQYQQKNFHPSETGKEQWRKHQLQCIRLIIESYNITATLNQDQINLAKRVIDDVNKKEQSL